MLNKATMSKFGVRLGEVTLAFYQALSARAAPWDSSHTSTRHKLDWRGKAVWIVGASSGIGSATASALHACGARVMVSARNAACPGRLCSPTPRLHRAGAGRDRPCGSACGGERPCCEKAHSTAWCTALAITTPCAASPWTLTMCCATWMSTTTGALYLLDAVVAPMRGARHRPHQPGRQCGGVSGLAQRAGLWAHQGSADQPGRNAVPGPQGQRRRACPSSTPALYKPR